MASALPILGIDDADEMLDEMVNGNFTDQDDGRDKFVLATLINEGSEDIEIKDEEPKEPVKMVKGVRISSNGEQEEGKPKFLAVEIPDNDLIFQLKPTLISTHMGLEIVVQKVCHSHELFADPVGTINHTGAYLNIPMDPEELEFGYRSIFLQELNVGPVRVVRRDKKDISRRQVEALAIFARFHIDEDYRILTRIWFGPEEVEQRLRDQRAFVRDKLTRAEFEKFFAKLKHDREGDDISWVLVDSPYDA